MIKADVSVKLVKWSLDPLNNLTLIRNWQIHNLTGFCLKQVSGIREMKHFVNLNKYGLTASDLSCSTSINMMQSQDK